MTFEELTNWLQENSLKDMKIRGCKHECYYKSNLFIVYRKNDSGKYELKTFTLKYIPDKNVIASCDCMCKKLEDFDMEDLEYYFEDFKNKQNFLALYIKNKYIQKRKYELAKDFNK
jgi:hypothetical protein